MKQYLLLLLGGIVLAGMAACSADNEATDIPDDGVKVRRITINQIDDAAQQAPTRASLTEGDGLTASWTAGDRLTYCNLSRTNRVYNLEEENYIDEPYSGPLTAASTAAASQFTGDVACSNGDYLAVVYPAADFKTNENYTVSLTGQDGTLATLATTFHYVYGRAHVTSVTDKTADATMEDKMKSLLTVCKFSFVDKDGDAIPVKTLAISYGGIGSEAGTYPQTAMVAIKDDSTIKGQDAVHAAGVAGNKDNNDPPLTITCPSEQSAVYVALLPTSGQRTFNFTVTDGSVTNSSVTYTGSAKATLTEGEYVVATGLRLTKQ